MHIESNVTYTVDANTLGRRIRKVDEIASETTLCYYGFGWQVLCKYEAYDQSKT